jgi:hypothetical protein
MGLQEPNKPHPFVRPPPSMLVVQGMPPMADAILAAFPHARGAKILYCWGTTIYASNGAICGPEKVAHETIHAIRQGDDVEGWWWRYIADAAFRFAEEVPAHIAEYIFLCDSESGRAARRRNLARIASALASPLYGRLVTAEKAKRVILDGASAAKSEGMERWASAN